MKTPSCSPRFAILAIVVVVLGLHSPLRAEEKPAQPAPKEKLTAEEAKLVKEIWQAHLPEAELSLESGYAEKEKEWRQALVISQHDYGTEGWNTLAHRMTLAGYLDAQGKRTEAEKEIRVVLAISERKLGLGHEDTIVTCRALGLNLIEQGKLREALPFMKRAEEGWVKALGPEAPGFENLKLECRRIEEILKKRKKDGK